MFTDLKYHIVAVWQNKACRGKGEREKVILLKSLQKKCGNGESVAKGILPELRC